MIHPVIYSLSGERLDLSFRRGALIWDVKVAVQRHWEIPSRFQDIMIAEEVMQDSIPVEHTCYYMIVSATKIGNVCDCMGFDHWDDLRKDLEDLGCLGSK